MTSLIAKVQLAGTAQITLPFVNLSKYSYPNSSQEQRVNLMK